MLSDLFAIAKIVNNLSSSEILQKMQTPLGSLKVSLGKFRKNVDRSAVSFQLIAFANVDMRRSPFNVYVDFRSSVCVPVCACIANELFAARSNFAETLLELCALNTDGPPPTR